MTTLTIIGDLAILASGIAIGVIFKDPVMKLFLGSKALSERLRAKADALIEAARK